MRYTIKEITISLNIVNKLDRILDRTKYDEFLHKYIFDWGERLEKQFGLLGFICWLITFILTIPLWLPHGMIALSEKLLKKYPWKLFAWIPAMFFLIIISPVFLIHSIFSFRLKFKKGSKRIVKKPVIVADLLSNIGDVQAIESLIANLKDKRAGVRWSAAEALKKIGWKPSSQKERSYYLLAFNEWGELTKMGESAVEALIMALKSEGNMEISAKAAVALGEIGDTRAIDPLIEVSKEGGVIELRATEALARIGKSAVEPLITVLEDKNSPKRMKISAAQALGKIRDSRAVNPLSALLKDKDRYVKESVVSALWSIGGAKAVEVLIEALKDVHPDVRKEAVWALKDIGDARAVDPLKEALKDEYEWVRQSAAEALQKIGWKPSDRKEEIDGLFALQAWEDLAKIGDTRAVELLIAALKDKDVYKRRNVAAALGKMSDARAAELLIAALRDENPDIRENAVATLVTIGKPAVDPLIAALKHEFEWVRRRAAYTLGKIGDTRAVESLIAALRDGLSDMRRAAANALGEIGDPSAIEHLIASLKDKESNVRSEAAESLFKIGKLAILPLIAVLRDKDSHVRFLSARVLGKIGDSKAVDPLIAAMKDEDTGVRRNVAEALGQIGDSRAVDPLIVALNDKDIDVRRNVAEALGQIGDADTVKSVSNQFVGRLPDWNSNREASDFLIRLKWQPQTESERVYLWIGQRAGKELKKNWDMTKRTLIEDIESNDYRRIENALYAFIGVGDEQILPILIKKLNTKGTKIMAEAYLNCGYKVLHDAASDWASRHGYSISMGSGAHPVSWGSF